MEKVIEVNGLSKSYGAGRGIFDVSFTVKKGETLGFLGPNGAGKSTTMRHLMGFSVPDCGFSKIMGYDTVSESVKVKDYIGYIPGEVSLPDGLKGYEFIEMMASLKHVDDKDRINYLLDLFKLDPTQNVKKMSIGEKRKLAIVTAFMADNDVLLLDEPTSGLDPHMQEIFIDFIKAEKKRGKTILLSSHIFSEVDQLCDRIAIIKDGKIVSFVSKEDINRGLRKIYNLEFKNEADKNKFKLEGFDIHKEEDNKLSIYIDDLSVNLFISKIVNYDLVSYTQTITTLEDYFMAFYKNERTFNLG